MIVAFELSMPNVNSWNGRWSGEGGCYAILKTFRGKKQEAKAAELCAKRSHYYNFGDGWGASVGVREVDAVEARRLRKASVGFCGYDWMVENIIRWGTPYCQHVFHRLENHTYGEGDWEQCGWCRMARQVKQQEVLQ